MAVWTGLLEHGHNKLMENSSRRRNSLLLLAQETANNPSVAVLPILMSIRTLSEMNIKCKTFIAALNVFLFLDFFCSFGLVLLTEMASVRTRFPLNSFGQSSTTLLKRSSDRVSNVHFTPRTARYSEMALHDRHTIRMNDWAKKSRKVL